MDCTCMYMILYSHVCICVCKSVTSSSLIFIKKSLKIIHTCFTLIIHFLPYLQVNAPTCPVIVVGTHLDRVDAKKASTLKQLVDTLYGDITTYPSIAAIACVSSTTVRLRRNSVVNILRKQIYFVATHLFLDRGKGVISNFIVT